MLSFSPISAQWAENWLVTSNTSKYYANIFLIIIELILNSQRWPEIVALSMRQIALSIYWGSIYIPDLRWNLCRQPYAKDDDTVVGYLYYSVKLCFLHVSTMPKENGVLLTYLVWNFSVITLQLWKCLYRLVDDYLFSTDQLLSLWCKVVCHSFPITIPVEKTSVVNWLIVLPLQTITAESR